MSNIDSNILDAIDALTGAAHTMGYVVANRSSKDNEGESYVLGLIDSKITEALNLLIATRKEFAS